MKKYLSLLMAAALAAGTLTSRAQFGGGPPTPQFGNGMEKLFGDNQRFSATMQIQMSGNSGPVTMSGKMYFDNGNSRFEMDMSQMQGANIPPQAMAQMKSIGLDKMVNITQTGQNTIYIVYPDAQAYTEMTSPAPPTGATNTDTKVDITALGNETVDGHPCVKNKAVVTDKQGAQHEFTVWNATDLKNFPVEITMNEQGTPMTMYYKDISFSRPDSSLFTPPSGFTKYDSMPEMMQSIMMKSLGGGGGFRPPQQ
jgi:outer membrane lipoprotein-sorting protein